MIMTAFADLPQPQLKDLMEIVGVDLQAEWESVGLGLGLEQSTLDTIRKDCSGDSSACMRRVFAKWGNGQTSQYSWKTIAEVVCSRTVNKPNLLPQMLEAIKKLPKLVNV